MKEPVGLIGIGLVGSALAENLLGAGYSVIGYDVEPGRCAELKKLSGEPAPCPRDVAER